MAKRDPQATISKVLSFSRTILAEEGERKLTLDAVVQRAGLSKGAMLHHFKSKDELGRRLMQDAIADFEARVEQFRGDDRTPGSYTRAYIGATLNPSTDSGDADDLLVMQALSRNPACRGMLIESIQRQTDRITRDGIDPELAQLLRYAADGLWLNEGMDTSVLAPETRGALLTKILGMAR